MHICLLFDNALFQLMLSFLANFNARVAPIFPACSQHREACTAHLWRLKKIWNCVPGGGGSIISFRNPAIMVSQKRRENCNCCRQRALIYSSKGFQDRGSREKKREKYIPPPPKVAQFFLLSWSLFSPWNIGSSSRLLSTDSLLKEKGEKICSAVSFCLSKSTSFSPLRR